MVSMPVCHCFTDTKPSSGRLLLLTEIFNPMRDAGGPIWFKPGGIGPLLIPCLHVSQFSLAVLEG